MCCCWSPLKIDRHNLSSETPILDRGSPLVSSLTNRWAPPDELLLVIYLMINRTAIRFPAAPMRSSPWPQGVVDSYHWHYRISTFSKTIRFMSSSRASEFTNVDYHHYHHHGYKISGPPMRSPPMDRWTAAPAPRSRSREGTPVARPDSD